MILKMVLKQKNPANSCMQNISGLERLKSFAQWPKTSLMATKKLTRKWEMQQLLQLSLVVFCLFFPVAWCAHGVILENIIWFL